MIFLQLAASFIAVVAFSINLEVPKKYVIITGLVGAFGWVIYLLCIKLNLAEVLAYFLSALAVSIISMILAKILKALSTIFLIPGILPIVPGIAIYKTIYGLINNSISDSEYYLKQVILITAGIALATFITESIKNMKIVRKEKVNEN